MLPEDARTVTELWDALSDGAQPAYLYFWRHYKRKDGVIGPSCLSQWWEESYSFEGVEYHSAEHFMMAEKARLFGDEEMVTKILAAKHPKTAKAYGRKVRGFNDRVWKKNRFDIVVRGNVAKFRESPSLREYLLNTGSAVLVEASPYDRIWGIGLAESNPKAQNPNMWKGTNLLGFALMEAREQLRSIH